MGCRSTCNSIMILNKDYEDKNLKRIYAKNAAQTPVCDGTRKCAKTKTNFQQSRTSATTKALRLRICGQKQIVKLLHVLNAGWCMTQHIQ
jgi:hypothetical protein